MSESYRQALHVTKQLISGQTPDPGIGLNYHVSCATLDSFGVPILARAGAGLFLVESEPPDFPRREHLRGVRDALIIARYRIVNDTAGKWGRRYHWQRPTA